MTRVDLHDEALLDHARAGTLTADARARLMKHCKACAACATELAWIEDKLHMSAPTSDDRARAQLAVAALLGPRAQAVVSKQPAPRTGIRVRRMVGLAASYLLFAGAAAAMYTGVQELREAWTAPDKPAVDPTPVQAKRAHAGRPHAEHQRAPTPVTAPSVVPIMPATSSTVVLPAQEQVRAPMQSVLPALERAAARSADAEALFASANHARASGDLSRAAAAYAQLAHEYRGTRSELSARVARGLFALESQDDPGLALSAFRDYLGARPMGTLAEEARVGVALSLQRMGQSALERQAWQTLLEQHPHTLHAERARARLSVLPP
jgi:hypothetical protein